MNTKIFLWFASIIIETIFISQVIAQSPGNEEDKSEYNLFNPVPRESMRPLSADRPDATESPITVDAGHFQVELSFFDYAENDIDGGDFEAWTALDANIKIGLLHNVDLQFVFGLYSEETLDPDLGPGSTIDGFGDLQIRTKINLWGNDGGETAFGIMPFIKIPTDTDLSNGKVEGGFIAMLGWDAGESWGLGFQAEADFVYDDADDSYDTEFLHTTVLGFDIAGPLGGYLEYVGVFSSDPGSAYRAILSGGVTYEVNENLLFDLGTQFGLTDSANDFQIFSGFTMRY